MTPSPDRPTIRVGSPAELLALVPYMLGFHPTSSLVAIALKGTAVLNLARLDLPTIPEQVRPMRAALHQMAATMNVHGATGAILVGYGSAEQVEPGVQAAMTAFITVSVPVKEALRVEAGRYWSYTCDNPACCPPDGVPFDPTTSTAAAAATVAGLVVLPDRAAMAARLDPVTGAARERMVEATAVAAQFLLDLVEAVAPGASDNPHTFLDARLDQALLAAGRTYLGQVADRYRAGTPVNDQQAALMTVLLDLPSVRDVAAWHTTGEPWEIDMWTDLIRRAEPEFTAAPAVLLTLSALRAGNGALAAMAVQRALQSDPADSLAQTLAEVVAAGIDPATVAALLAG